MFQKTDDHLLPTLVLYLYRLGSRRGPELGDGGISSVPFRKPSRYESFLNIWKLVA